MTTPQSGFTKKSPGTRAGISVIALARRLSPEQTKTAGFITGLIFLAICGFLSWRQPMPGRSDQPANWKWFFYSMELNPGNRPPVPREDLEAVSVLPSPRGRSLVIVGGNRTIVRSKDDGVNWELQPSEHWTVPPAVTFTDAVTGKWAEDLGSIWSTSDGGRTWMRIGQWEPYNIPNPTILDSVNSTPSHIHGVAIANTRTGCVVGNVGIVCTANGKDWTRALYSNRNVLNGIAFADPQRAWVVGDGGTILNSIDGGAHWTVQASGTGQNLRGIAFADAKNGWAVGDGATIVHTSDGGAHWSLQEYCRYRRYPAPWFYFCVAGLIPFLLWASSTTTKQILAIEEIVAADIPVESIDDDRLGQSALVERLAGFLQNPKTVPPLVLSIQAQWGMGKSSVMRMLESSLRKNRAAVTVWFNAWHHQTEDQLLAFLLETIQKEAVPQWLSPIGISFRLDLLRIRLFSWKRLDRLAFLLASIALVTAILQHAEWLPHILRLRWLTYVSPLVPGLAFLNALIAFKSNPEKLTGETGGFLVNTIKELVRLPSIVGKSDVRQEFAANLADVVEALRPQRLVIFLDDLDRCRPEQIIQILEAINFLGTAAPCFIIVGADYEKVEALVADQFEKIAIHEEENKQLDHRGQQRDETLDKEALDPIRLRVAYARSYLKKIVNLRINLRPPTAINYADLLRRDPAAKRTSGKYMGRVAAIAAFATPVFLVVVLSLWSNPAPVITQPVQPVALTTQNPVAGNTTEDRSTPAGNGSGLLGQSKPDSTQSPQAASHLPATEENGGTLRIVLTLGLSALVAVFALLYWFSRPRRIDEAVDADTFTTALGNYSVKIFEKCGSPRELRRFINYLRLVATTSGPKEIDEVGQLREGHRRIFDDQLVDMAVSGDVDTFSYEPAIVKYYTEQCYLLGLSPKSFEPYQNGNNEPQQWGAHSEAANSAGHKPLRS